MNVLPKSLWSDLMHRFDAIYGFGVKQIQLNLDREQVGYDSSSLLKDMDQIEWSNKEESKLYIETAVKWQSMMEKDAKYGEDECHRAGDCPAAHRISFVMNLFKGHFLKQMVYDKKNGNAAECQYLDLFTRCLAGYSTVSLLNDYDHIRSEHTRNANDRLRDCKEPGMYTECSRSLRTLRERTNTANRKVNDNNKTANRNFMSSLSDQQHVLMEISMKIHSFLNHTDFEDDEQKGDELKNHDDGPLEGKETVSKFVNEIDAGTQTGSQSTKMDGLISCLVRGYALNEQSVAVQKWMDIEQVDTDFMEHELETATNALKTRRILKDDDVDDSNLSLVIKDDRYRIMKQMVLHLEQLGSFSFGSTDFYHWKYFEKVAKMQYIKTPKYSNLKEEALNNSIYSISMSVFNQIMIKSLIHQMSKEGKKKRARNSGNTNNLYEIPGHSPLSVAHILVVIMYTDLDDLQREYKKKGCRESNVIRNTGDPAFIEYKELHREISWWFKLLRECVDFWGTICSPQDVFYTGLNCRLVFDSLAPMFRCPISTTTSESVAHRFSKGKGLILKMKPSVGSTDIYMDVEWLSAFGEQEKERLFVRAVALFIVDIQSFDGGKRKKIQQYIKCFTLFSSMFKGHFIGSILKAKKAKTERILLSLICQYKADAMLESTENEDIEAPKFSFFVEQLFLNLLSKFRTRTKERIYIIASDYMLLSEELRNELISFSMDTAAQKKDILKVSLFLKSLECKAKDVVLMDEYIWTMDEEELNALRQNPSGLRIWCREQFVCKVGNSGSVMFKLYLKRKVSDSKYAGFGFQIIELSFPSISGFWSVDIQETGWYQNELAFFDRKVGAINGTFAFKDSIVNDINGMNIRFSITFWE